MFDEMWLHFRMRSEAKASFLGPCASSGGRLLEAFFMVLIGFQRCNSVYIL